MGDKYPRGWNDGVHSRVSVEHDLERSSRPASMASIPDRGDNDSRSACFTTILARPYIVTRRTDPSHFARRLER